MLVSWDNFNLLVNKFSLDDNQILVMFYNFTDFGLNMG